MWFPLELPVATAHLPCFICIPHVSTEFFKGGALLRKERDAAAAGLGSPVGSQVRIFCGELLGGHQLHTFL